MKTNTDARRNETWTPVKVEAIDSAAAAAVDGGLTVSTASLDLIYKYQGCFKLETNIEVRPTGR